ncbi:hypothetical protein [Planotetraspora mira]|uniref:Uncharacterized protein n=1 Tax=Planotetraspora mira TaxID=58121 RepID=A0A8J3TUY6_9ACTN|nr:hypothetical protein [Planotetraspora mira]GII33415.1 hypothetical protein Pmi06nite_68570 [Planotetraspora mira]
MATEISLSRPILPKLTGPKYSKLIADALANETVENEPIWADGEPFEVLDTISAAFPTEPTLTVSLLALADWLRSQSLNAGRCAFARRRVPDSIEVRPLNGTFGTGKISIANELARPIPKARYFDTEQFG